ncbi:MAG: hypothetical protein NTX43_04640 [Bacteroidetes bacterium]|nr:hypothetical protein [Bacteroidota bacterium]
MRSLIAFLIIHSCLLPFSHPISAQSWNYIKEKNGIKIYTYTPDYSSFKCFKGVTVFHATMKEIGLYIGNVRNFSWWDDNIRELRVLDAKSDDHVEYYFVYHVSWPLSDRDFYVDVFISTDSISGEKIVYAKPLKDTLPERDGIVRIKKYWQKWTLKPIDSNSVHAELEGFVDPGGSVPSWLYNLVIVETPLKVMGGIKHKVEVPGNH